MTQLEPLEEATSDLLDLFTRTASGQWCFNSLSKDGSKLDAVMERIDKLTPKRVSQPNLGQGRILRLRD